MLRRTRHRISGQDLAEYGVALGVISTIAVTITVVVRASLDPLWWGAAVRMLAIAAS